VKMSDDDIEKLEHLAEREGKTKSSFMRELAEEKMEKTSISSLEELKGVLSQDESESVRKAVRRNEPVLTCNTTHFDRITNLDVETY